MSEPTQYAIAADIRGMSPEEIEAVKQQLSRGRDAMLQQIVAIDGEVFYTETVTQLDDRIEHRVFVYEAAAQMLKVWEGEPVFHIWKTAIDNGTRTAKIHVSKSLGLRN
jgi:FMN phosphatase YigB (HAD superfamily)